MKSNNRAKFLVVFKHGFLKRIKSKGFIITNVVIFTLALLISFLPSLINAFGGDFDNEYTIYYDLRDTEDSYTVDVDNGFLELGDVFTVIIDAMDTEDKYIVEDYSILEEEITINEDSDKSIVIVKFVVNDTTGLLDVTINSVESLPSNLKAAINTAVTNVNVYYNAASVGLTPSEVGSITTPPSISYEDTTTNNVEDEENLVMVSYIFANVVGLLAFMFLLLIIQSFGAQLQEEKTSGTIEVVYSSVSAKVHLFGRILSESAFSILQMALFGLYAVIAALLLGVTTGDSSDSSGLLSGFSEYAPTIVAATVYTMFLLIITIFVLLIVYAMFVSKSKDQEDLVKKLTPLMMVLMVPFMLMYMLPVFTGSNFFEIASIIPVFSLFLAPSLLITGDIGAVHIIISFILLAITIVLVVMWMNKSYKANMLGYSMQKEKKHKKLKK